MILYSIHRLFYFFGGLFGALGIAAYAASSHISSGYYGSMAPILLGHGIILIVLAFADKRSIFVYLSGVLIILGVIFFAGDLFVLQTLGVRLFCYAAPIGGMTIILGWLLFCIIAFLPKSSLKKIFKF